MKMLKSKGPRIEPRGTPLTKFSQVLPALDILTRCRCPLRQQAAGDNPYACSFATSRPCGRQSNALERSIYNAPLHVSGLKRSSYLRQISTIMICNYGLYEMHWQGCWILHKRVLIADCIERFRIFWIYLLKYWPVWNFLSTSYRLFFNWTDLSTFHNTWKNISRHWCIYQICKWHGQFFMGQSYNFSGVIVIASC